MFTPNGISLRLLNGFFTEIPTLLNSNDWKICKDKYRMWKKKAIRNGDTK